jgi:predicted MFS family arabinose efflux permease
MFDIAIVLYQIYEGIPQADDAILTGFCCYLPKRDMRWIPSKMRNMRSVESNSKITPGRHVLPLIVFSQFCGTSLWFASNGIMGPLTRHFGLPANSLGDLTASVQFGFITGTLVFALLTLADRFPPSRLFFWSAVLGTLANLGLIWEGNSYATLLLLRFMTGFFLAGIYPVGMKIASDYYEKGLGTSLGYLVGALVLGTAFPHLLGSGAFSISWKQVVGITSALALTGGLSIWFLPDGPYRSRMQKLELTAFFKVFKKRGFRAAAFGYFGHMWELYAFWAFVPLMLGAYGNLHPGGGLSQSLWSFMIIGIGGPACVLGGYLSRTLGPEKVAAASLMLSGFCCLLFPWALQWDSPFLFLLFMLFWGMVVIADSPLFSTLVAQNAASEKKGTALTIVTCIGFAITILSIEFLAWGLHLSDSPWIYSILAAGPALGLFSMRRQ